MPRANSSVPRHRRHRKIVKQAKGYYGARSRNLLKKLVFMPIEIEDKENVSLEDFGSQESMQLPD